MSARRPLTPGLGRGGQQSEYDEDESEEKIYYSGEENFNSLEVSEREGVVDLMSRASSMRKSSACPSDMEQVYQMQMKRPRSIILNVDKNMRQQMKDLAEYESDTEKKCPLTLRKPDRARSCFPKSHR